MNKYRIWAVVLLALLVGLGFFMLGASKPGAKLPFKFGLDLVGGTELTYHADVSGIAPVDVSDSMNTLHDVIERRINIFGVSEPVIQVEDSGLLTGNPDHRLIVDLPGVTNIDQAVALIGQTPLLEFDLQKEGVNLASTTITASTSIADLFTPTGLTGRYLSHATLQFDATSKAPTVLLSFNSEGTKLFSDITTQNTGKTLAIILDGDIIEAPTIDEAITSGQAVITGGFTPEAASALVRQLNYGALPVPISLVSTQTVGASLGQAALQSGLKAGLIGFAILALFMILWYRLPGFIATVALVLYVLISLSLFRLIPVTLTAAGLAGFILSIGMAVDANVLIFERMKEELRRGKPLEDAMHEGFHRAWLSIRDSNISSIITAVVLFWLGTEAVKGFALTLGVGVLVSMFTAITASRTFLFAVGVKGESKLSKFLFGSGFHSSDPTKN